MLNSLDMRTRSHKRIKTMDENEEKTTDTVFKEALANLNGNTKQDIRVDTNEGQKLLHKCIAAAPYSSHPLLNSLATFYLAESVYDGDGLLEPPQSVLDEAVGMLTADQVKTLVQAADDDNADAQYALGILYCPLLLEVKNGKASIKCKNVQESIKWLEKSAKQKHPAGCVRIGQCYAGTINGDACLKNPSNPISKKQGEEIAANYYRIAGEELGTYAGLLQLRVAYLHGRGVAQDEQKAKEIEEQMKRIEPHCEIDEVCCGISSQSPMPPPKKKSGTQVTPKKKQTALKKSKTKAAPKNKASA
eukprot:m.93213 g.93213  ORF g.93213 m.93213 type:complete len:304 (-) comp13389_c0_seq2:1289-2200(-)